MTAKETEGELKRPEIPKLGTTQEYDLKLTDGKIQARGVKMQTLKGSDKLKYFLYRCPNCSWITSSGRASKLIRHLMSEHGYSERQADGEINRQQMPEAQSRDARNDRRPAKGDSNA